MIQAVERTAAKGLRIGELAQRAGVNLDTVRFYEREGLLPKPPRAASGYRAYPSDAVERVQWIKRTKALGFSLNEIKELLAIRADADMTCADVKGRAEQKLQQIDQKIRDLRQMRRTLADWASLCPGEGSTDDCPLLQERAAALPVVVASPCGCRTSGE